MAYTCNAHMRYTPARAGSKPNSASCSVAASHRAHLRATPLLRQEHVLCSSIVSLRTGTAGLCSPVLKQRQSSRRLLQIRAEAAAADSSSNASPGWVSRQRAQLKALITPFSDPAVNRRLLALCFGQALCSVATLIHDTYLPVYLQDVLGLSNTKIGNLQAVAQFLCNASKSLSGTLADILSPARMVIFGTLLTTLNKPMFAMSGYVYATFGTVATLYWVTAGKVFDRMSKGIREAPGKALIGDLAEESGDRPEGAFGLRQAMGTAGALVGSAIAGLAYNLSGRNYILTFALAAIPATLALVLISSAFAKQAKDIASAKKTVREGKASGEISLGEEDIKLSLPQKAKAFVGALKPAYWQALAVVSLLYFARFDASFITLRAKGVMPKSQLPLIMSSMMLCQAFLSTSFGLHAKRSVRDRNNTLLQGFGAIIAANLSFALLPNTAGMFLGAGLVGLHMAMTHGILLAMLSSYIPSTVIPGLGKMSGTCWSFTDFVLGIVLAYSNSVAGKLADVTVRQGQGNIGCFYGGAVATLLSGLCLILFSRFGDLGKELPTKKAAHS